MAEALPYFQSTLGFSCPTRKDMGSFLQARPARRRCCCLPPADSPACNCSAHAPARRLVLALVLGGRLSTPVRPRVTAATVASPLQEITTPVGQVAYATPEVLARGGLTEEDRDPVKVCLPAALLVGRGGGTEGRDACLCLLASVPHLSPARYKGWDSDHGLRRPATRAPPPPAADRCPRLPPRRPPAQLLTAPPKKLLTSIEEMEQIYWRENKARGLLGAAPAAERAGNWALRRRAQAGVRLWCGARTCTDCASLPWPARPQTGTKMLAELSSAPFNPADGRPGSLLKQKFAAGWAKLTSLVFWRQVTLNKRDKTFYIVQACQVGYKLGSKGSSAPAGSQQRRRRQRQPRRHAACAAPEQRLRRRRAELLPARPPPRSRSLIPPPPRGTNPHTPNRPARPCHPRRRASWA